MVYFRGIYKNAWNRKLKETPRNVCFVVANRQLLIWWFLVRSYH